MLDSDPLTIHCENREIFHNHLTDRGITTVILTWRAEWAPATATPGEHHGDVVFGSLREVTLLAYHKPTGVVIKLDLRGDAADREAIRRDLLAAGLRVEERSRNLT